MWATIPVPLARASGHRDLRPGWGGGLFMAGKIKAGHRLNRLLSSPSQSGQSIRLPQPSRARSHQNPGPYVETVTPNRSFLNQARIFLEFSKNLQLGCPSPRSSPHISRGFAVCCLTFASGIRSMGSARYGLWTAWSRHVHRTDRICLQGQHSRAQQ